MSQGPKYQGWLNEVLATDAFLLPFLSTVGASLTVLFLQFMTRYAADKRKKIYAVNYMLDVCRRSLSSNLLLQRQTVIPHIEAAERILKGDNEILHTMFAADEFEILRSQGPQWGHLSEDYKVLIGYDDIEMVQMFEAVRLFNEDPTAADDLNAHVKKHLHSEFEFTCLPPARRDEIIGTYWDCLNEIDHEMKRSIFFTLRVVVPRLEAYLDQRQFRLFQTRNASTLLRMLKAEAAVNSDLIPADDYMQKRAAGGIRRELI